MMNIKISRGYEACYGCGGFQAKKKIIARYSGKSIELCDNCFKQLVEETQKVK